MNELIRSEFRKLRTTRGVFGLAAAALALIALAVIGIVKDSSVAELSGPLHSRGFLNVLPILLPVFLLAIGIRSFTEEFRHGSIVPTLLASPRRRRVLLAKLVTTTAVVGLIVVAAEAVAIGLGLTLATAQGATITISAGSVAASIGTLLAVAVLWAGIGVGVGLIVTHQAAALVGAVIWLLLGEQLVGAVWSGAARFLPAGAANGVFGSEPGLLAPLAAGSVLAGWTAASLATGALVMDRRDIA